MSEVRTHASEDKSSGLSASILCTIYFIVYPEPYMYVEENPATTTTKVYEDIRINMRENYPI